MHDRRHLRCGWRQHGRRTLLDRRERFRGNLRAGRERIVDQLKTKHTKRREQGSSRRFHFPKIPSVPSGLSKNQQKRVNGHFVLVFDPVFWQDTKLLTLADVAV